MTVANCPACGAPIRFRFAQAVQKVCEYCRSVLVRHDVALDKVGEMASVPDNASPIQLGTEGVYRNKPFVVVGRIILFLITFLINATADFFLHRAKR